ncbi:MAG: protease modulator HflC [Steroidobacteraceae bacterium]
MANRVLLAMFAVVATAFLFLLFTFTVRQNELAIKFAFGDFVRSDYQPGLHFMLPMVNNVRKFDKRIITRNYPEEQFLTSEGKILLVDFYVKFQINNVESFYKSTSGDEDIAASRLGGIVKDGLKGLIAKRTIQQVVIAERAEFINELLSVAGVNAGELGVRLVDVRVKKINLPNEVSESVYNRMRQDFARQAAQLRAEGSGSAEQLRAEAERTRTEVLANATRDASIIRGDGDSEAAKTYANAFGRNAEFYSFYRSLQAYRQSIGNEGDVLVISPDSEFFKYLNKAGAR